MALQRLQIKQFRNIASAAIEPASGLNLIHGDNGSGKTSLLEAIWYLSLGRSFRTHPVNRLIQYETEQFTLFGQTQMGDKIGLRRTRSGDNEIRLNGMKPERISVLATTLPLQLISPESFTLLLDGPQARREFIDWGAFHADPEFVLIWSRYKRLVKQRNQLLRSNAPARQIAVWDQQLSVYGEQLTDHRRQWVNSLNSILKGIMEQFLPDVVIDVSFSQGWESNSSLADLLNRQIERDRQIGYTVSGPHKADLKLRVDRIPVGDALSRGQLKLLVCALKIAQGRVLSAQQGQHSCIYLVDDLASELDEARRALLLQQLEQTSNQVFVTAIEPGQLDMIDWQARFHVKQGRVIERNG